MWNVIPHIIRAQTDEKKGRGYLLSTWVASVCGGGSSGLPQHRATSVEWAAAAKPLPALRLYFGPANRTPGVLKPHRYLNQERKRTSYNSPSPNSRSMEARINNRFLNWLPSLTSGLSCPNYYFCFNCFQPRGTDPFWFISQDKEWKKNA